MQVLLSFQGSHQKTRLTGDKNHSVTSAKLIEIANVLSKLQRNFGFLGKSFFGNN